MPLETVAVHKSSDTIYILWPRNQNCNAEWVSDSEDCKMSYDTFYM